MGIISVTRAVSQAGKLPTPHPERPFPGASQPAEPSDAYLLEQVIQGDEAGMAILYDRYSKVVYWSAIRVLRDQSAAEDVVQDVFMMIWRRPEVLSNQFHSFSAWMTTVARNRACDIMRSRQRRPMDCIEDVSIASSCDQETKSEHELMAERAALFIQELPEEMRFLVQMAFHRGMTHSEIAQETGLPLGTVKTKIRTGLLRVRDAFSVPDGMICVSAESVRMR